MGDGTASNGGRRFDDLARAVDRIEQHIVGPSGLFVRVASVEQKLDERPCQLHSQDIEQLKAAQKATANRWGIVAQVATALVAIGAVLWRVAS